jgi:hypothetical protein
LPPLAPQVSQIGNAALVEREAVTLPLDYAFGLSLPEVRALQSKCTASADALAVAGFLVRGRETGLATGATVSATASFLLRRGRIAHFRFRRHSPCPDLWLANTVANYRSRVSYRQETTASLAFLAHWWLVPSRKPLWWHCSKPIMFLDIRASSNSG